VPRNRSSTTRPPKLYLKFSRVAQRLMLTEAARSSGQPVPNGALARDQSRIANERVKWWTMKRQDHRIYALVEGMFASGDPWTLSDLGIEVSVKRVLASLEGLVACFNEIENKKIRSHAFKALEELLASSMK
jgi:hypothetical protein